MNLVASKQALTALVFAVGSLCISGVALAAASSTYSFTGVTNTNSTNTNLGKGSLFVEVIDLGFSSQNNANQVAFKFTNTSASSLTSAWIAPERRPKAAISATTFWAAAADSR